MFGRFRQSSGFSRIVSVVALCVVSVAMLVFSTARGMPEFNVEVSKPGQASAYVPIDVPLDKPTPIIRTPRKLRSRPASFSEDPNLGSVLGGINGRYWADPSTYSPDLRIDAMRTRAVGTFHGVGFPDIRTYRKKRLRHNPLRPQPWAPMIAWRQRAGKDAKDVIEEPIARVRCMGLTPQAVARRADRYIPLIRVFSMKYNVNVSLIKAVVSAESCFNTKARSRVGAQGLMQLMPRTASWLNVQDPHDPEDNLEAGVRYLALLMGQFDTLELALAAYNAGPGNVRRYGGIPPFAETRAYVVRVQANYRRYAAATQVASR